MEVEKRRAREKLNERTREMKQEKDRVKGPGERESQREKEREKERTKRSRVRVKIKNGNKGKRNKGSLMRTKKGIYVRQRFFRASRLSRSFIAWPAFENLLNVVHIIPTGSTVRTVIDIRTSLVSSRLVTFVNLQLLSIKAVFSLINKIFIQILHTRSSLFSLSPSSFSPLAIFCPFLSFFDAEQSEAVISR